MPSEPTRKPADQQQAAVNIALRGPTLSTQVPKSAALMPSITMAIENTKPIAVCEASKCSMREFL